MKNFLLIGLLSLLLVGCSGELPSNKHEYIGLWKNNNVSLLITEDGGLNWEKKGAVTTSVSAPIKEFGNDRIVAGILFFTTEFVINEPAREVDGIWTVTVDDVQLFKANEQGQMPQATQVPKLAQLRELVELDLKLLSSSVLKNDFTDYIENASMTYQSQFDNEKLKKAMKAFIDRKISLETYMVGDFQFTTEPRISELGALTVAGKYPTKPNSLKFSIDYIYVHPQWKSLGANVSINNK